MERYSTPVVQHICLSTNIFSKSKEELLAVFGDNERNQNLASAVQKCYSRTDAPPFGDLDSLLSPAIPEDPDLDPYAPYRTATKAVLDRKHSGVLAMYLSALKTLDRIHALTPHNEHPLPQRNLYHETDFHFKDKHWKHLRNLEVLIKKSRKALESLATEQPEATSGVETNHVDEASVRKRLSEFQATNRENQAAHAILDHFVSAAIQLCHFLRHDFKIENAISPEFEHLTHLTAATLVDPLYLLTPRTTRKDSLSLEHLIIAAKIFGTTRPLPIQSLNSALFSIIIQLFYGTLSPYALSQALLGVLRSPDADLVCSEYSNWYFPSPESNLGSSRFVPKLWENYPPIPSPSLANPIQTSASADSDGARGEQDVRDEDDVLDQLQVDDDDMSQERQVGQEKRFAREEEEEEEDEQEPQVEEKERRREEEEKERRRQEEERLEKEKERLEEEEERRREEEEKERRRQEEQRLEEEKEKRRKEKERLREEHKTQREEKRRRAEEAEERRREEEEEEEEERRREKKRQAQEKQRQKAKRKQDRKKRKKADAGHDGSDEQEGMEDEAGPSKRHKPNDRPNASASFEQGSSTALPTPPPESAASPLHFVSSPSPMPPAALRTVLRLTSHQHLQSFRSRKPLKHEGADYLIPTLHAEPVSRQPTFDNQESRKFWNLVGSKIQDTGHSMFVLSSWEGETYDRCVVFPPDPTKPRLTLFGALQRTGPMHITRVAHDIGKARVGKDWNSKHIRMSVQQFYDMTQSPRPRSINILDLPVVGPEARMADTLALVAWNSVDVLPFFKSSSFPQQHFTWYIVASAGTSHGWHVDADGLGTRITVLVGEKIWFVAVPEGTFLPASFLAYATPIEGFVMSIPEGYRIFVVCLTQNTEMDMPPGTFHCVTTTQHAVCYGSHSYSWKTMLQTLWGLILVRIKPDTTNASHECWSECLVRILAFFHQRYILKYNPPSSDCPLEPRPESHLPSLVSRSDWINLSALCVIVELVNLLSTETYRYPAAHQELIEKTSSSKCPKDPQLAKAYKKRLRVLNAVSTGYDEKDLNALSNDQRMAFIGGRAIAHDTVCSFDLPNTTRTFRQDVFVPMMASTLYHMKHALETTEACKEVAQEWNNPRRRLHFDKQFQSVVERYKDVHTFYQGLEESNPTFKWSQADMNRTYDIPESGYELRERNLKGFSYDSIMEYGATSLDMVYLAHL